ncbi:hypothetical protein CIK77_03420 [Microbacterium sp. JB110]|nr:hypothetical protein CIK77_03420 [Microbacterium sp. JB110]
MQRPGARSTRSASTRRRSRRSGATIRSSAARSAPNGRSTTSPSGASPPPSEKTRRRTVPDASNFLAEPLRTPAQNAIAARADDGSFLDASDLGSGFGQPGWDEATRSSTSGWCRRTSPAWRPRSAAGGDRGAAGHVHDSLELRRERAVPVGGQRAELPRAVDLQLPRAAVEDAGVGRSGAHVAVFTAEPDGARATRRSARCRAGTSGPRWASCPRRPARPCSRVNTPTFDHVRIELSGDRSLTINAPGATSGERYIDGLSVDGEASDSAALPESVLSTGGVVDLDLSAEPGSSWATAASSAPPSFGDGGTGFRAVHAGAGCRRERGRERDGGDRRQGVRHRSRDHRRLRDVGGRGHRGRCGTDRRLGGRAVDGAVRDRGRRRRRRGLLSDRRHGDRRRVRARAAGDRGADGRRRVRARDERDRDGDRRDARRGRLRHRAATLRARRAREGVAEPGEHVLGRRARGDVAGQPGGIRRCGAPGRADDPAAVRPDDDLLRRRARATAGRGRGDRRVRRRLDAGRPPRARRLGDPGRGRQPGVYGNSVVAKMPMRYATTDLQGAYVYATEPYSRAEGRTIESVTLPSGGDADRLRLFAIADDGVASEPARRRSTWSCRPTPSSDGETRTRRSPSRRRPRDGSSSSTSVRDPRRVPPRRAARSCRAASRRSRSGRRARAGTPTWRPSSPRIPMRSPLGSDLRDHRVGRVGRRRRRRFGRRRRQR